MRALALLIAALALGFLAAVPAQAQDNCEVTSTCKPKPPRQTPPPPPPPDPCNANWQRAERSGTIASYDQFLRTCSRHTKAPTARRRIAGLRCDAQYETASRVGTESVLQGFINACGNHPKVPAAQTQITTLRCEGQWQTALADQTLDGFENFTRTCPNSGRITEARGAIARIRANPLDIKGLPARSTLIPRDGLSADNKAAATKCEGGDAVACSRLGYSFDLNEGAPKSPAWAKALYARGCAGNSAIACANLGIFLDTASGRERDLARSAIFAQKGCELGAKHGCVSMGIFHEAGKPLAYDLSKAVSFYEQGCDQGKTGGSALGCLYAARFYDTGRAPIARNPAKALQLALDGLKLEPTNADLIALRDRLRPSGSSSVLGGSTASGALPAAGGSGGLSAANQLLQDQCNRNDGPACLNLGKFLEERNLAGDRPMARTLFGKSCLAGQALVCLKASAASALDGFGPYDFAAVRDYFDRIPTANQITGAGGFECNLRPFTCFAVAQELYRPSKKPFGDKVKAAQFARASCDAGELRGCNLLGRLRMEGQPVQITEAQALEYFSAACSRGQHAAACNNLGKARETGFGLGGVRGRNIGLAAASYRLACGVGFAARPVQPDWPGGPSFGKAEGCYNLGRFYRDGIQYNRNASQADIHFTTACTLNYREACAAIQRRH